MVNWEMVEGNWTKLSGKVKEQWAKLTDDDVKSIEGKRDQLIGTIQAKYGIAREEAEKEVSRFTDKINLN